MTSNLDKLSKVKDKVVEKCAKSINIKVNGGRINTGIKVATMKVAKKINRNKVIIDDGKAVNGSKSDEPPNLKDGKKTSGAGNGTGGTDIFFRVKRDKNSTKSG